MSNRMFWGCAVVVSMAFGAFVTMGLHPADPASAPTSCVQECLAANPAANEVMNELNEDAEVLPPKPPLHDLEWYKKNIKPPAEYKGTLAACFAPGTPMEIVNYMEENIYGAGLRYNLTGRWSGAQGTPRALTWSFVPDGLSIPGANGEPTSPSNLFATLDVQFASAGGRATWISRIQSCFDRWQALTGITYTRVTFGGTDWDDGAAFSSSPGAAGLRGDCRISMHPYDGPNGVLAYNFFPSTGDMVLDSGETWTQSPLRAHLFLRNIISHEHGHGIGLLHVCPANATKLMEPFISTGYDTQRHDDIRAGQRHYGDVSGSNNTAGTARALGLCEVGAPINAGTVPNPLSTLGPPANSSTLSIDANGEQDFYTFTVAGSRAMTITVTPRGLQYASYVQDANCNNAVVNTDSLSMANLSVDLIDTNGVTVLSTAAAQPIGVAETISAYLLPAAGTYYVKVYEADAPTQSQLYLLDITAQNPPCTAPTVDPIPPESTACGSAYNSGTPTAAGTPPMTWSLGGIPPVGMTINPGTGQVSWPNPVPSLTPYAIQVIATNACGNDSEILTLTVLPGDFDGNGVLNDLDIQPLVDHILGVDNSRPCAADVNFDTFIDGLDILAWTDLAV